MRSVSWWPRSDLWNAAFSAYNVGYWSASCEAWFQERLSQIRVGRAQPKSAVEWKAYLRRLAYAMHFRATYEACAAIYLQDQGAK